MIRNVEDEMNEHVWAIFISYIFPPVLIEMRPKAPNRLG